MTTGLKFDLGEKKGEREEGLDKKRGIFKGRQKGNKEGRGWKQT